ncbi:dihydroflavonol-4-reductase [Loigolactobacillus bifermentans DSM 20003]|uniref:Dihydroflavonol-4-reductase n=2 Tax=Loigolactobacillus bifermentans TaxID=1607 RepID=A0A0R1H7H0_9LACO|nr:dihydroflavonol-4-reductase [Loigolactobacillus bifermentans DSM 20003]QGG61232.1 NAD-dependent epimerase/dehydratase family protein [Loigolactobacillus bifermentans]
MNIHSLKGALNMQKNDLVLVTGITGYMATWLAQDLLQRGYRVRGTYRSTSKLPRIKQLLPGIELVPADLNGDAGWAAALKNVQWLFHVASPQAVATESHRTDTAIKGIDNIFKVALASPTLQKIVLTSSEAAIAYGNQGKTVYTENDWTNAAAPGLADYMKSKTLEEHRAWQLINDPQRNPRQIAMTAINPSFVLGPSLVPWARYSAQQIKQLLRVPFNIPMQGYAVDVRDVAQMQMALMQQPAANGTRNLAIGMPMSMAELKHFVLTDFHAQGLRGWQLPFPTGLLRPFQRNTTVGDFYPRLKGQVTYQPLHPAFYQPQFTDLRQSLRAMVTQLLRDGLIGRKQNA